MHVVPLRLYLKFQIYHVSNEKEQNELIIGIYLILNWPHDINHV